ncbi:hypothetical protein HEQ75_16270 [Roseomonas sp. BU-1]|uniref:SGNH/GDSL hydrolase family protein n=2 Tax=Falsiroseomonas selenitidurans TaxID=2716335 RepID=A0ABX1E624_9PROT|nr:hypothetical protein [Falsiroseomonas selenitidurans]
MLALAIAPAGAQTRPQVRDLGAEAPRSAIYIGNSFFYYNNSMHGHVNSMIRLAPPPAHAGFATSSVTISGSGLNWHDVESYFRPNALRSYSFDRQNNIVFNTNDRLYEIAIMMDCSQCPIHPRLSGLFAEYARKHSETVRRHGAQPVFFMSWAYADKPEMTQQLAEAYTVAGNANNALVIPAGLAFARAIAERPALNLYVADKRHPSLAGTYLAAATTYAALFGRSPEGNRHTAGLDADTAAFLQRTAWATVRDYYGERRAAAN